MGAASGPKGAKYERRTAAAFTDAGIPAERNLEQTRAGGDDLALPPDVAAWLSVECKDVNATSVGAWLDQAVTSADGRLGVVIHHRRGNGNILDDFATVRVRDLLAIVRLLRQEHTRITLAGPGDTRQTGDHIAALIKDLRP